MGSEFLRGTKAKWLELERSGSTVTWKREGGSEGALTLTEAGRLRSSTGEEEMIWQRKAGRGSWMQ